MRTSALRLLAVGCALALGANSAWAATPKPGRYKGTITIRHFIPRDPGPGIVAPQAKKVIPIAAVLTGTKVHIVAAEQPVFSFYFESYTFTGTVTDGALTLFPNNDAVSLPVGSVKTTASAIKGSVESGFVNTPSGDAAIKTKLELSLTRVGN